LGFRVLRLYADRGKVNMAGESTDRQAIKEHVVHAVALTYNAGMTDFNPAAPKPTLPPEGVCAMRGRFISHGHR
jgi:hypothetical protein